MKKKKNWKDGIVYSTDPEHRFPSNDVELNTPDPSQQELRIVIDRKHRGGKTVTLVSGFIGRQQDLEELSKKLKSYCGTGGSAKDNEIIIQGDHKEKLLQWLLKNGYKKTR